MRVIDRIAQEQDFMSHFQITQGDLIISDERPLYGDYKSIILIDGEKKRKYLVKENFNEVLNKKDEEFYYYLEALGARFYKIFSPDSIVPETSLILMNDGQTRLASSWIDEFIPYENNNVPVIKDGKVIIKHQDQDCEVLGYISTSVAARFFADPDAIGLGVNAGYIPLPTGQVINVKIDPGRSFGFMSNYNTKLSLAANLRSKLNPDGMVFHGHVSLDFLDENDPQRLRKGIEIDREKYERSQHKIYVLKDRIQMVQDKLKELELEEDSAKELRSEFQGLSHELSTLRKYEAKLKYKNYLEINKLKQEYSFISAFIYYFYPNFDSRDLLLGEMTYAEISKHQNLYNQLASTVESIVSMTEKELSLLVGFQTPKKINGEWIGGVRKKIFKQILERQKLIHKLYAQEVEYMKLYRNNVNIDFEEIKILAAKEASQLILPSLPKPLQTDHTFQIIREEIRRDLSSILDAFDENSSDLSNFDTGFSLLYPSIELLFESIEKEELRLTEVMLSHDFLININSIVEIETEDGTIHTTALMRTKKHQSPAVTQILLKHGADPEYQVDEFGRIYDISNSLPHVTALQIINEVIDNLFVPHNAKQAPEILQLTNGAFSKITENYEIKFLPAAEMMLDVQINNGLVVSLYIVKEFLESHNIAYVSQQILHLPKLDLPNFMDIKFWTVTHCVVSSLAAWSIGVKLTVRDFSTRALESIGYGLKLYSIQEGFSLTKMLLPSSGSPLMDEVLLNLNLYHSAHPHYSTSVLGIFAPLVLDGIALFKIAKHTPMKGNNFLYGCLHSIKAIAGIINVLPMIDHSAKVSIQILENEVIYPSCDYIHEVMVTLLGYLEV